MAIKLSIEALEVIDAIDRKGSFAAAAESLYRVPSALTYTIRKLEEDLGITLFDRSGHRAALTEAGAELLKEGRYLLDAAQALECRVRRVATGVETDITIAVSDLFNFKPILDLLEAFYAQGLGTRVKLLREVYGGSWDVLQSNRADISIGAPGDAPPGGGFSTHLLGQLDFVFAVAPHHPLANMHEPLSANDIVQYRAVAAADSSRNLPPRTSGILSGQDILTVPDMQTKLQAQISGVAIGYLPKNMALQAASQGLLVIKQVAEPKPLGPVFIAWRQQRQTDMGKAMQWLLKHLCQLSLEQLLVR
ncbi:LysR family transcriptional regulator [Methylophilus aquaticus]|uniref:LysR family transcriptional regulator n=1 Tax=Methylophilus aquaticus TaxID=1971610 RepID=A0ABT9JSY9_9PROT|nr:LysR family transcriptional regulator [Methylophilus aquaticus]MDP8567634.1 LysR family transcriptional regulator [Methylophilus aquaticus]